MKDGNMGDGETFALFLFFKLKNIRGLHIKSKKAQLNLAKLQIKFGNRK
ncbi:hypothetical protein [Bacillus sp. AFS001701]|nr:hypothetical protein [Bacillus sp. AFS001701]